MDPIQTLQILMERQLIILQQNMKIHDIVNFLLNVIQMLGVQQDLEVTHQELLDLEKKFIPFLP